MGAFVARKSSRPPAAPRAGVVVCHELFGVTMHVREVCERIAALGYVALAPDLYHRSAPGAELAHDDAGRDRGFELLRGLELRGRSPTCGPPSSTCARAAHRESR